MRSVADQLRDETRRRVLAMDPAARLEAALQLGDEDVSWLSAARGISEADARLAIDRARQSGRLPSSAARR